MKYSKEIPIALLITIFFVTCKGNNIKTQDSKFVPTNGKFYFSFEMPDTQINIPEIEQINMGIHPLAASLPHLRFMGSKGAFNLSINTPTADEGMTSEQCAKSIFSSLIKRNQLGNDSYSVFRGSDLHTYGLFYASKIAEAFQLHAHLVSSNQKSHCIEVHISKVTLDSNEITDWLKGMPGARINSK